MPLAGRLDPGHDPFMMSLAGLISPWMPACAGIGAQGLPTPEPIDMGDLRRPATPNTALAAPPGFIVMPDIFTPEYAVPAEALYSAIARVALGEPRTAIAAEYPQY